MNWIERETVSRLDKLGFDFGQYLHPVAYTPIAQLDLLSNTLEDVEDEGEEEFEE